METHSTGFKIRLIPTLEQVNYFEQAVGVARWAYNFALDFKQQCYKEFGVNQNQLDIRKEITQMKKTEAYSWLNNVSNNITKQAVKDCDRAFTNFFKGRAQFPKFKSKKFSKKSFYCERVTFKRDNTVTIEKVGTIKLSKSSVRNKFWYLSENGHTVLNPRISYDGFYWYLSFGVNVPTRKQELTSEILGIDLGVKDTAICSNGKVYNNINKTAEVKRLEKRKKRLQRKISRKYLMNKQGNKFIKTKNIIREEKKLLKLTRHITNIRLNYTHQVTSEIVKTKPSMIVIENLNIKGMMKNRHLSKAIQQQLLYELQRQVQYKSERIRTRFVQAPRNYKSTQLCSSCGSEHKMRLSDRVYKCTCGLTIDRDLNSAYNLRNYGLAQI